MKTKLALLVVLSLIQGSYAAPKTAKCLTEVSEYAMHASDSMQTNIGARQERTVAETRKWLETAKSANNWKEANLAYRSLMYMDKKIQLAAYSDSLLATAVKTGDDMLIGSAYLTKGIISNDLKKHREALNFYLLAERYLVKTGDAYSLYKLKYSIASTKCQIGMYTEAIALFRQCVAYYEEENDRAYLNSLHYLGLCYNRNGDFALSKDTNLLGIKAGKELGNTEMEAYFKHSLGVNSYFTKNYDLQSV